MAFERLREAVRRRWRKWTSRDAEGEGGMSAGEEIEMEDMVDTTAGQQSDREGTVDIIADPFLSKEEREELAREMIPLRVPTELARLSSQPSQLAVDFPGDGYLPGVTEPFCVRMRVGN